MAEVLGIVGSVVGIAAEGIKLSHTLNTYAQKVRYAGNEVKGVANDIQDTAVVLDQLGQNLKSEENYMICKPEFYSTTSHNIKGCAAIFKEIDTTLSQIVRVTKDEKGNIMVTELKGKEKLKWPFKQTRIALLRTDLDRLKSNLNLMMNVMKHARDIHEREVRDKDRRLEEEVNVLMIKAKQLQTRQAENRYLAMKRKVDRAAIAQEYRNGIVDNAHLQADLHGGTSEAQAKTSDDGAIRAMHRHLDTPPLLTYHSPSPANGDSESSDVDTREKDVSNGGTEMVLNWPKIELFLSRIANAQEVMATPADPVPRLRSDTARRVEPLQEKASRQRVGGDGAEESVSIRKGSASIVEDEPIVLSSDISAKVSDLDYNELWSQVRATTERTKPTTHTRATSEILQLGDQKAKDLLSIEKSSRKAVDEEPCLPGGEDGNNEESFGEHVSLPASSSKDEEVDAWTQSAHDPTTSDGHQLLALTPNLAGNSQIVMISRSLSPPNSLHPKREEGALDPQRDTMISDAYGGFFIPVEPSSALVRSRQPYTRTGSTLSHHSSAPETKTAGPFAKSSRDTEPQRAALEQNPNWSNYVGRTGADEIILYTDHLGTHHSQTREPVHEPVDMHSNDYHLSAEDDDLATKEYNDNVPPVSPNHDVKPKTRKLRFKIGSMRFSSLAIREKLRFRKRMESLLDEDLGHEVEEPKNNNRTPTSLPPARNSALPNSSSSPLNPSNPQHVPPLYGPQPHQELSYLQPLLPQVFPSQPQTLHPQSQLVPPQPRPYTERQPPPPPPRDQRLRWLSHGHPRSASPLGRPENYERYRNPTTQRTNPGYQLAWLDYAETESDISDLRFRPRPIERTALDLNQKNPVLETWVLRRADPLYPRDSKSWMRITRLSLPIEPAQLSIMARKKKKKAETLWQSVALLSTYQQQQIHRLFQENRLVDSKDWFDWNLVALETGPTKAKAMDIRSIQLVLERSLRTGVLSTAVALDTAWGSRTPRDPATHKARKWDQFYDDKDWAQTFDRKNAAKAQKRQTNYENGNAARSFEHLDLDTRDRKDESSWERQRRRTTSITSDHTNSNWSLLNHDSSGYLKRSRNFTTEVPQIRDGEPVNDSRNLIRRHRTDMIKHPRDRNHERRNHDRKIIVRPDMDSSYRHSFERVRPQANDPELHSGPYNSAAAIPAWRSEVPRFGHEPVKQPTVIDDLLLKWTFVMGDNENGIQDEGQRTAEPIDGGDEQGSGKGSMGGQTDESANINTGRRPGHYPAHNTDGEVIIEGMD